jgi:hypothetical protein
MVCQVAFAGAKGGPEFAVFASTENQYLYFVFYYILVEGVKYIACLK